MTAPFGAPQLRWLRTTRGRARRARVRRTSVIERYYNFGGEGIATAQGRPPESGARGQRAGDRLPRLPEGVARSSAARAADAPLARTALRAGGPDRHAASAAILPPGTPRQKVVELEWGADTDRFRPHRRRSAAPYRRPAPVRRRVRRRLSSWHGAIHLVHAIRDLRRAAGRISGRCSSATAPSWPHETGRPDLDGITFTGAVPHAEMPAFLAAADIGVAPFDVAAHRAAGARVLLVAAQDLRVHGVGPAGGRAGDGPHSSTGRARARGNPLRPRCARRACRRPRTAVRRPASGAAWRRGAGRVPFASTVGKRTAPRLPMPSPDSDPGAQPRCDC